MTDATPHILCVIYGTELYGSERGTLQALIALRGAGHRVTVVGSGRKPEGGQTGKAVTELGFPLYLLPFGSHLKRSWMVHNREYRHMIFGRIRRCSVQFRRISRTLEPTHVILCGTSPLPFILPALLLDRTQVIYRMGDAPIVSSKIHYPIWRWLIRKSTTIVAISDYMKTVLLQHGRRQVQPNKVHVIRNIPPHRKGVLDPNITSSLTQSKRPFQLVYVGQLTPKKGIHLLVEALMELNDPDIGCWIVGDFMGNQPFDDNLREMLHTSPSRTQIDFVGYKSDPRPYYKTADWHIAPSTYEEPLGNVVQEAQLQGTPSIVTNKGGLPELIDHKVTGWILSHATKDAIVHGIRSVMNSPGWASECPNAIRTKREKYGPTEFSQAWLTAINAS